MAWQVAVCEPGRAVKAGELLRSEGYSVFVPLMREHRRKKVGGGRVVINSIERPLFGPYLFIDVTRGWGWMEGRYIVRLLRGVGDVDGVVSDGVMAALMDSADQEGVIVGRELPRVRNSRCIDFVAQPGDLCNVTLFSLQRLIGVIHDVSRVERTGFLDVLVEILGRECKVNVHYTQVQLGTLREPPSGANRRARRTVVEMEPA
jgi:transcription antitermination factor NusG